MPESAAGPPPADATAVAVAPEAAELVERQLRLAKELMELSYDMTLASINAAPKLYTIPEASAQVGYSDTRSLRRCIDEGELRVTHKLPGMRGERISHAELVRFIGTLSVLPVKRPA